MNPVIQLKQLSLVALLLTCFALSQSAQAVVPPPDGGYPNFTTAEGTNALQSLTTGAANTAVGWYSLFSDTEGSFNTATGAGALLFNTNDSNTAFGAAALLFNTYGFGNTAVGAAALVNNTASPVDTPSGLPGRLNTAVGLSALSSNTTGSANTASGASALLSNTTGNNNTAIGSGALRNNTTGSGNIALGQAAGISLTTGNNNICIAQGGVPGESATIRIGGGNQERTFIGGILGNGPFGCDVSIDPVTGQLGVGACISSERFKKDIDSMDKASEAIFSLKPVTFHYKNDKTNIPQFGLIAEEVAKVNPALIAVDKEGKPYSVRYQQIDAMLLNEFLKEHRTV
jgi:Chaperone of endosialidase